MTTLQQCVVRSKRSRALCLVPVRSVCSHTRGTIVRYMRLFYEKTGEATRGHWGTKAKLKVIYKINCKIWALEHSVPFPHSTPCPYSPIPVPRTAPMLCTILLLLTTRALRTVHTRCAIRTLCITCLVLSVSMSGPHHFVQVIRVVVSFFTFVTRYSIDRWLSPHVGIWKNVQKQLIVLPSNNQDVLNISDVKLSPAPKLWLDPNQWGGGLKEHWFTKMRGLSLSCHLQGYKVTGYKTWSFPSSAWGPYQTMHWRETLGSYCTVLRRNLHVATFFFGNCS